jgi:PUA domain protein
MNGDSGLKLKKNRAMRRRDANRLKKEAEAILGPVSSKTFMQAETEDGTTVYFLDGEAILARREGLLFPTLISPLLEELPSILVDMGAIPYVCNGADIMAPGIIEVRGNFGEERLVVIRDVTHNKALSVGLSLVPSKEMREMRKGKAIMNLHYVGDKLWQSIG